MLSTALAFKGGTALRRVHFGEYRLANDVLVAKLERVETTLRTAWVRRLSMQVEVLPEFDDSFREVKRLMREFDALRGFGTC